MTWIEKDDPKLYADCIPEYCNNKSSDYNIENNISNEISRSNKAVSMTTLQTKDIDKLYDEAIIGVTTDFKILTWSKGAEKKFGYKKCEIVKRGFNALVPEDRLNELKSNMQLIKAGNTIEGYKTVRLHKSGKPIDVSISIAPVYGSDGNVSEAIAIFKDITLERRIMEELKDKYDQIKEMKERLERANNEKTQFLANISHEIRASMNGVFASVQLLESCNLNYEQKRYVDLLKSSVDNLAAVINSVLDAAKLELGKIKLINKPFNLKYTLNSIYNSLLAFANIKGLKTSCYIDPNIDYNVVGDEIRLRQILINLLSNAIKFTDRGYVFLRANLISAQDDEQEIEFCVKDTGIGIDEYYKPEIFEKFSQGDLTKEKNHLGVGLGLPISKQLAKLMNGDIHFDSTVGEGSTFYFTCKLKKAKNTVCYENHCSLASKSRHDQMVTEKVILCIEDNLIDQEILENRFKRIGYKYLAAYDGKEALEILEKNHVDLILMDIQMNGLNGYEVTRLIRNMEGSIKNIPIIAITAYGMHEDREKCIQAG